MMIICKKKKKKKNSITITIIRNKKESQEAKVSELDPWHFERCILAKAP